MERRNFRFEYCMCVFFISFLLFQMIHSFPPPTPPLSPLSFFFSPLFFSLSFQTKKWLKKRDPPPPPPLFPRPPQIFNNLANSEAGGEQTPEPRSISIARAAYVARNIRNKCNNVHQQTLGEVMEFDSGLLVVVAKSVCHPDDHSNDNLW